MAHTAHHDDHAHEKNSHHHAPADPRKVLPGVIFVLALFWVLTYAGHYMFIQSAEGGHGAPAAHAPADTHGADPAADDAGHH
ncbi:hypothetical protein [Micavibrio aeruginosavorus]|uniref:Uncharacterized protein n=1 Tax=Micavibrio aeruginosavorus EPB TaxID=349215 RepID=M4VKB7_9BACT|nr:hypothetical protein [Micavibrio aeruginosavorus]AGH98516.1 hypothetical protein A11S_1714 [Micavibrio aeruginosavorus EPB]